MYQNANGVEESTLIAIGEITETINYIEGLSGVVFDLDDTLYSEKEYVRSGYKAIASFLPYVENAESKLWAAFENNLLAIDVVLENEGLYSEKLKTQCLDVYRYHKPSIHLYDGVLELFNELQCRKIEVGIITDGRPKGQWAKIKALGLEKYVKHIIVTDELGGIEFRKPCEKAFLLMAEKMELPYREMCYVGDNIQKDFVSPGKLGMRCVWFRNSDGLYKR